MADEAWRLYQRLVARAWSDANFKKQLLADPKDVLQREGVRLSADMKVAVIQDKPNLRHFVLPMKPEGRDECEDWDCLIC